MKIDHKKLKCYQAKLLNIWWFQLPKCAHVMFFFKKLNIFGFWTFDWMDISLFWTMYTPTYECVICSSTLAGAKCISFATFYSTTNSTLTHNKHQRKWVIRVYNKTIRPCDSRQRKKVKLLGILIHIQNYLSELFSFTNINSYTCQNIHNKCSKSKTFCSALIIHLIIQYTFSLTAVKLL